MIGRITTLFISVVLHYRRQVEVIHYIGKEVHQMIAG